MCGRYAILEEEAILEMREIINQVNKNYRDRLGLVSAGEIAPTRVAPILRDADGKVRLDVMKWGFPRWDTPSGLIINARSESVLDKKMFREAFLSRRIVVPASGFYEWDHRQSGSRDRYFFTLEGQVTYMAGIYSIFPAADGSRQESFVILTRPAGPVVAELHDRMPVIMPKNDIRTWLDPRARTEISAEFPRATAGAQAWLSRPALTGRYGKTDMITSDTGGWRDVPDPL
jgi:putative SOS response-associated peptidase YedK